MFRFQSSRMYEIIASAVVVAAASVALIKRLGLKTAIPPKTLGLGIRYAAGGTIFGRGWAPDGSLSGTTLRAGGQLRHGDDRRDRLRAGWDLGLRVAAAQTPALTPRLFSPRRLPGASAAVSASRVHGSLGKLLGIHFAQTLIALHRGIPHCLPSGPRDLKRIQNPGHYI